MPKGYSHVTRDIRCQIYALKSIGISLQNIAKQVGKDVSTISREITALGVFALNCIISRHSWIESFEASQVQH